MRGPEYMRAMRRLVLRSGVRVLDKHPALELLLHADGSVAGAAGIDRASGAPWTVRAGAVVLATDGCAFMSHLLGCHTARIARGKEDRQIVCWVAEPTPASAPRSLTGFPHWLPKNTSRSPWTAAAERSPGSVIARPCV